jgi:mannosyltransferase OCH1-like enzyme
MSIPKIIHHTYKNHDLPEIYKMCQHEIKRLHPDFEYRFYTDDDMDKLMKTEFPEYYDKFNELPRMIMKIDMFRYFLMYKYGGLYTDMDYLMFKPFDLLNEKVVIPCNREDENGNIICLGNCIFASQPNHPYWKSLMDTLFTIDRTKLDYNTDQNIDGNVLGTGPMFVFSMWQEYSKINDDICVSKRNLFHPSTKNNKQYIKELKENGCYGMHICTGLWRNNKL